jgi:8-oxo-dGTP diphosphatase
MDPIIKIGLVKIDERGRLLVVRKHGGRTFILPGGKPEGDESDVSCLMRECHEEVGVGIVGAPVLIGTFGAPAADMKDRVVLVRAYTAQTVGEPVPQAEIEEIHWLDVDAPAVPIADSIRNGVIPTVRAMRRD